MLVGTPPSETASLDLKAPAASPDSIPTSEPCRLDLEELEDFDAEDDADLLYTERCEYAYTEAEGHGAISRGRGEFTRCEYEVCSLNTAYMVIQSIIDVSNR